MGVLHYKPLKELERKAISGDKNQDAQIVGSTLSELYSIGFSALLGSAASALPDTRGKN